VTSFRNYPIAGIQDLLRGDAPSTDISASSPSSDYSGGDAEGAIYTPFTGVAFSYVWWMLVFQLVIGVGMAGAAAATPKLRLSALALVTVLTTSCFMLAESVCNAYMGVYQITHNASGTAASVLDRDAGTQHVFNGVLTLFAGAIVCSVANSLTLVFLGIAASPAEEAAAPKAETAKAEEAAAVEEEAAAPAEAV
jgi:hypothetical protein